MRTYNPISLEDFQARGTNTAKTYKFGKNMKIVGIYFDLQGLLLADVFLTILRYGDWNMKKFIATRANESFCYALADPRFARKLSGPPLKMTATLLMTDGNLKDFDILTNAIAIVVASALRADALIVNGKFIELGRIKLNLTAFNDLVICPEPSAPPADLFEK
jgi:hypothetical protein